MVPLEQLWVAMTHMHDLVDTRSGWERTLGEDFTWVERYLRPVRGSASSWPCGVPGSEGCTRRVIRHRDGSVVAVCTQEPTMCDRIELMSTDLARLRLDLESIATDLRSGLVSAISPGLALTDAAVIGDVRIGGLVRLVLTRHHSVVGLLGVAESCASSEPRSLLVLLAPVQGPPVEGRTFEDLRTYFIPLRRYGIRVSADRWELDLGAFLVERRSLFQGLDPTPFLGDAYDLVLDPATVRYWARGQPLELKKRTMPRRMLEALARRPRKLVVRKELGGAVWPDAVPGEIEAYETNLRTHKMNLDRVLAEAGAAGWIVAVEGSDVDGGYLLDLDPARVLWWSESADLVGAR